MVDYPINRPAHMWACLICIFFMSIRFITDDAIWSLINLPFALFVIWNILVTLWMVTDTPVYRR